MSARHNEAKLAVATHARAVSEQELAQLETFLAATVREAGQLTLRHFRRSPHTENKRDDGRYDPVTEADRAAEELIRERIRTRYPRHGIFGEEHGIEAGDDGLTWVVDPIDGTRSFISGQLHWGVLIALYDGRRPILGAMYQPFTDELFIGSPRGAFLERAASRQRLHTRACAAIDHATLGCTTPEMFSDPKQLAAFTALSARVRVVRYGGDCYSYCMLAHGLVDLVVESSLAAYDIQALIPIVEAAGGAIVSWTGGDAAHGGAVVAYGDPALRAPVLQALAFE